MPKVRPAFDPHRFKELILYVAKRSEDDPRFGATKLNKLLFFADFQAYGAFGRSLTGARYWKIQLGPAPVALVPARAEMEESGELEVRSVQIGTATKPQVRLIAHREPDPKAFSDEERDLIDSVIQRYWEMNGTQISQESYKEVGVQLAEEQEDIPYGTVYIPSEPPTKADIAYARQRMKERGWAA